MGGNIHLFLRSRHRFVNEWEQAARSGGRCSCKLHSTSSGAPVNFRPLRKLCVCNQLATCSGLIPRQGWNAKCLNNGDAPSRSVMDPFSYCISPHKSSVTIPSFLQPSSEESRQRRCTTLSVERIGGPWTVHGTFQAICPKTNLSDSHWLLRLPIGKTLAARTKGWLTASYHSPSSGSSSCGYNWQSLACWRESG